MYVKCAKLTYNLNHLKMQKGYMKKKLLMIVLFVHYIFYIGLKIYFSQPCFLRKKMAEYFSILKIR